MHSHNEFPCDHFVAVSYCYSAQPGFGDDGDNDVQGEDHLYSIVEEDGSTRQARAPRAVIDRAVAFAAQNGYRMVWIDQVKFICDDDSSKSLIDGQECIEQDNELERTLGVEAMDFVYVNAHITIGLYSANLKQEHLDNLLMLDEDVANAIGLRSRGPVWRKLRNRIAHGPTLVEALKRVTHDPWNTRAWILQEAFASAENMLILLPQANGVSTKHLRLVCHQMSSTEICISFEVLYLCLKIANVVASRLIYDVELEQVTKRLEWFSLRAPKERQPEISVGGARPRDTCNAAVALAFLRLRDNSVVAGRLAIIANLCGYELRFDSLALQRLQRSLALCVLALSVMNGDLSLLTPEMYAAPCVHQMSNICEFRLLLTKRQGKLRSGSLC